MSEEIIIDGVDVAECDYLFEDKSKRKCSITLKICNYHPTCYYKKLKRLEQKTKEQETKLSTAETAYQICLLNKENRHKEEYYQNMTDEEIVNKIVDDMQNEGLYACFNDYEVKTYEA